MNGLGAAMREAAEDVDVRAGFTGDVLRGGRSRQRRRRNGIALTLAAVVGVMGFGAGMAMREAPPVSDERLVGATKGDLADDEEALLTATVAWRAELTPSWTGDRGVTGLRGEPHVYWAGRTPVGDAAVVMQEGKVRDQWRTLVGLVARDPADGFPKVVGTTNPEDPTAGTESFQFGPGDRTFLVVDPGISVYVSPSATRNPAGVVRRAWQEVPVVDGTGLWTAPDGIAPSTVRLVTSIGPPISDIPAERLLTTRPAGAYLRNGVHAKRNGAPSYDTRMWNSTSTKKQLRVGPDGPAPPPDTDLVQVLENAHMTDIGPPGNAGTWCVYGTGGTGGGLLIGEYADGDEPSTLFTLLFRADGTPDRVLRGPAVDLESPLPVRVRLPDGQGWVVASPQYRGIAYRTSDSGGWQETGMGSEAALLPDDALQVRVGSGNGEVVVDLPR